MDRMTVFPFEARSARISTTFVLWEGGSEGGRMRTLLSLRKGKRKGRSKQTDARLTLCAVNASRPPAGKGREEGRERVSFEMRKCHREAKEDGKEGERKTYLWARPEK